MTETPDLRNPNANEPAAPAAPAPAPFRDSRWSETIALWVLFEIAIIILVCVAALFGK